MLDGSSEAWHRYVVSMLFTSNENRMLVFELERLFNLRFPFVSAISGKFGSELDWVGVMASSCLGSCKFWFQAYRGSAQGFHER